MKPTPKQEVLADFFNALAHPRRQMIFKVLQQAGSSGLPFHRLLARTGLKRATLAFHLGKMANGRIVRRRIKGPETWLTLDYAPFTLFQEPISNAHLTKN
jgi:DNA-binding transcriptional ArsR family regulator